MQALSQLSYGPLESGQSTGEVECRSVVYPALLVVPTSTHPDIDLRASIELFTTEKKATIKVGAIDSDEIDLVGSVHALAQALSGATCRVATHSDDITVESCVLALHSVKARLDLEDEVRSLAIRQGFVYANPALRGGMCDRELRYSTLLIGCEHDV
jgi:hypothetical protein